jgi:hypothetical protein
MALQPDSVHPLEYLGLDEPHAAELRPDSLQRLRRDLSRSIGQQLALEHVQSEPLNGELEPEIDLGLEW